MSENGKLVSSLRTQFLNNLESLDSGKHDKYFIKAYCFPFFATFLIYLFQYFQVVCVFTKMNYKTLFHYLSLLI